VFSRGWIASLAFWLMVATMMILILKFEN